MIPSFCNQIITRIRPGIKESRGSVIPDWENINTLEISPCSVQPSISSISLDGRVLGLSDSYTIYCNPDADVQAGDKILYDDNFYIVTEAPRNWKSPTGLVSSTQFIMTLWKG